jgi:hypothetical protein
MCCPYLQGIFMAIDANEDQIFRSREEGINSLNSEGDVGEE